MSFRVTSEEHIYLFTFITIMDLISRKISTKDVLRKMMYANDLTTTAQKKNRNYKERWMSGRRCSRSID